MLKHYPMINISPEVMGGTPVFAGHEVRVKGLYLHLVKSDNTSRDECEI